MGWETWLVSGLFWLWVVVPLVPGPLDPKAHLSRWATLFWLIVTVALAFACGSAFLTLFGLPNGFEQPHM